MSSIKTVTLSGAEVKVDGLSGQNTIVQNFGGSAVYASVSPGVAADADGVARIPAGGALNVYGTRGTIYLKGAGKVQLIGTDYSDLNSVSAAAASGGSSVGSGSDDDYVITKEEIDALFK